MQTLIPQPASATAQPIGRTGRVFGFGLTPLALLLFLAGLLLAAPAFWHPKRILLMLAWDALVLLLALLDAARLPRPRAFTVTRTFLDSPQLGQPTRVELSVTLDADAVIDLRLTDDLAPALVAVPTTQRLQLFPRDPAATIVTVYPRERGDFAMGRVYLQYRGALKLAERWAVALPLKTPNASVVDVQPLALPLLMLLAGCLLGVMCGWETWKHSQNLFLTLLSFAPLPTIGFFLMYRKLTPSYLGDVALTSHVRVFPALEDSRQGTEFYLLRARQIEMQKRRLRLRGTGRDFESLRDYQQGDELRNVSWTATARRNKLVARQFTVERSQQVWIVLDAGRLSRTAFELRRGSTSADTSLTPAEASIAFAETEAEREAAHLLTVTQLDQAASAASLLAQVINGSGDKFAMMAYGRTIQQLLPPGSGPAHLRLLIDLLSRTRSERAEADHLAAIARLKNLQRRRGLIVWVTELVDSAGRPELVTAAAELVRRHLVVLVLLKHPELDALASSTPATRSDMFHAAAAQEMLERRREMIAQLERQGVLIVETTAAEVGVHAISKYLEVKAQGWL